MLKRMLPPAALLALLVLVAACGGNSQTATPAGAAATATVAVDSGVQPTPLLPTATAAPALNLTPVAAATPTVALAGDIKDALAAMSALDSYHAVTHYEFSETSVTGTVSSGVIEMQVDYTKKPVEAQRLMFSSTSTAANGSDGGPQQIEMVRIGTTTWMNMGDNNWIQTSDTQNTPFQSAGLLMDSPELLVSIKDARAAGTDTINGIPSRHYTFDQKQLPFFTAGDMDEAKGEFWIAVDGGYISKYALQAQGSNVTLSNEQKGKGTVSMSYQVSKVNQPITIEAPKAANTGPAGFASGEFPLPADAETQMSSQNFSTYLTSQTVADVAAFYTDKLKALGWTATPGAGFSSGDIASLAFEKAGTKLSITITKNTDSGKTQILVSTEATP